MHTRYEPEISKPHQHAYVHSYHINIINNSSHRVQLLNRYWLITDASNQSREVRGPGVIGKQPILDPGESHQYGSWSPVTTPLGKMRGYYEMVRLADNFNFIVDVPEFKLISTFKLN